MRLWPLRRVALEVCDLECVALQAVTLEAMTASRVLHEFSLLASRRWPISSAGESLTYVKKDVMQPLHTKSREKGSRKTDMS